MCGFSFKGNPEFKLFIQQLGEVNSLEDLDQNPAILTFRAARYGTVLCTKLSHQAQKFGLKIKGIAELPCPALLRTLLFWYRIQQLCGF